MSGLPRRLSLLGLCLLFAPSLGYQTFQTKIPNGDRVPDPAQANILWKGVGHLNAQGGGARNVFGVDFKASGYEWTVDLCKKDSDGDGKSNGEELGDPDCTWTPGNPPTRNTDLSHPGICEPLDKAECQEINKDIKFESAEPFDCPATKKPDVKASDLRFPTTEVPDKETSYFCKYFDLNIPEGTTEHAIGFEPIIDNAEVMHHAIIYGCRAEQSAQYVNESADAPAYSCQESMVQCQEILFLWTVGINGQCHPDQYGGLLGVGGYTGVVLEVHWNNGLKKAGMTDSSGIKLYHTPNLRPENAAYVLLGPTILDLPPGKENILQAGGCGKACTETFPHSIFVTEMLPHMHYYGRAMEVSLNGKNILSQRYYNYDSPDIQHFDTPLEIKPGDDISVNCTFTTTSATEKTYFGLGTYDEMCFAITLVHPYDSGIPTFCNFAHPDVGQCGGELVGDTEDCDPRTFYDTVDWVGLATTLAVCDSAGIDCHDGCEDAVESVMEKYPCFVGKMGHIIRAYLVYSDFSRPLLNQMTSCMEVTYDTYEHDHDHDHDDDDDDDDDHHDDDHDDKCKGAACDGSTSLLASVSVVVLTVGSLFI